MRLIIALLFIAATYISENPKLPELLRKSFIYVNPGEVKVDTDNVNVLQGFYLQNCEVTNKEYREFLIALKSEGKLDEYRLAQVDSQQWTLKPPFSEWYTKYYNWHVAFDDYLVVNISRKGAELYCQWLTEKTRAETGSEKYLFRLPTRAEWIKAANGNKTYYRYGWGGPSLRNSCGKYVCNFKSYDSQNIHFDTLTKSYKALPADNLPAEGEYPQSSGGIIEPVKAYWTSDLGFFNLNGNVAEMVQESNIAVGGSWNSTGFDVRNQSVMSFNGPSPEIGFRVCLEVH
jgi:formylglycine-generating enzyme required for sulfatase activity